MNQVAAPTGGGGAQGVITNSGATPFLPLTVWYMAPSRPGYADNADYANEATGAAAIGINVFEGVDAGGVPWPEAYGKDNGELAILKAAGLKLMAGGPVIDGQSTTSAQSVNSILALASAQGALANIMGYMGPDEPHCNGSGPFTADMPALRALVKSQDPTRPLLINQTAWMLNAGYVGGVDTAAAPLPCLLSLTNGLQASDVGSADLYPVVNAWGSNAGAPYAGHTDYTTVGNDNLYEQAIAVQHIAHYAKAGSPVWMYVETGSDTLNSFANNVFSGSIVAGSTLLQLVDSTPRFSSSWNGMTVSGPGIPANTKITYLNATQAIMSHPATATSARVSIVPTGGITFHGQGTSCLASVNLCLATGQEYRATPAQVGAEAWMSLIAGAVGIEWFCQDGISQAFCLGGNDGTTQGRADAQLVAANLSYLNSTFKSFAGPLTGPVLGQCSMDSEDYVTDLITTNASCSGGRLTMVTGTPSVPGLAIMRSYNGQTYLFAQSDRRSSNGAAFSFILTGYGLATATVVYDSNARYDPAHSSVGAVTSMSAAGGFSDWLGAYGDDYQVKVYLIKASGAGH